MERGNWRHYANDSSFEIIFSQHKTIKKQKNSKTARVYCVICNDTCPVNLSMTVPVLFSAEVLQCSGSPFSTVNALCLTSDWLKSPLPTSPNADKVYFLGVANLKSTAEIHYNYGTNTAVCKLYTTMLINEVRWYYSSSNQTVTLLN